MIDPEQRTTQQHSITASPLTRSSLMYILQRILLTKRWKRLQYFSLGHLAHMINIEISVGSPV